MGIFFDNNIFAYKYFEIFVCINFLIEVYSDLRVQTSFKYFMKTYAQYHPESAHLCHVYVYRFAAAAKT